MIKKLIDIKNKKIWISILGIIFFLFFGAADRIKWISYNTNILNQNQIPEDVSISAVKTIVDNKSGYDIFLNGIGMGSIPFIVIIALLIIGYLFSQRFAYFLETGFGNMCITRKNFKKYFLNNVKEIFTNSFFTIFIAEIIFLIMCILIFSTNKPIEGYSNIYGPLRNIYYSNPFIYCLLQILNQSMFFSVFALLGFCVTTFIQNKIIISLMPFIIYMIITIFSQISSTIVGQTLCKLIYPDFILFPFLYTNYITYNNSIDIIIGYLIYILVGIILLKIMYNKFSKNYVR